MLDETLLVMLDLLLPCWLRFLPLVLVMKIETFGLRVDIASEGLRKATLKKYGASGFINSWYGGRDQS